MRLGAASLRSLGRLSREVQGALCLLVGLLAGIAIYSDAFGSSGLGPVGHLATAVLGDVFGWARVLIPAGLAALGLVLAVARHHRGPSEASQDGDAATTAGSPSLGRGEALPESPERYGAGRLILGLVLACVALAGLLALAGGDPHLGSSLARLRGAGGLVGAGLAQPGEGLIGVAGTGVVLAVLMVIGLALLARLSLRQAVAGAGVTWRAGGRATRNGARAAGRAASRIAAGARSNAGSRSKRLAISGRARGSPGETGGEIAGGSRADGVGSVDVGVTAGVGTASECGAVPIVGRGLDGEGEGGPVEGGLGEGGGAGGSGVDTAGEGEQAQLFKGVPNPPWRLPSPSLLKQSRHTAVDRKSLAADGQVLERALAAHGVETRLVGMTVGPTVTRFELELGAGVKVARVTSLSKDIAYAMASPDVRILAPIPGRSAIGVEVPNRNRQLVALADILGSEEARRATHPLEVAMGCDIAGRSVMSNLAEMPHILIAGATGAGKSSCINSLLTSILMRATPDQVRLILVDPKRVELGQYNGLPHLLTQVVVNPKRAANALAWAVREMERRYDLLAEIGVRDITGYNQLAAETLAAESAAASVAASGRAGRGGVEEAVLERLPFILVVVDELNDLMMVAARDVEDSICRIAQMARAVGIHLVIATQRPSVDVITGVIKANVPSRLAFSVSSLADSRVILDQPGAERLVGKGDMLLLTSTSSTPRRIQGPWVSEAEVRAVVAHWRRLSEPSYVAGVEGEDTPTGGGGGASEDDDDLLAQAMELVVRSQLGSTSMLQRKLRVGFARAGRLMDLLERRGVVGPSEGSKARAVLMTLEEFDQQ
ncbi:MAG: DNA translocase FtsK [Acidimicrobiales bacterium]